jgi:hypothetical protein
MPSKFDPGTRAKAVRLVLITATTIRVKGRPFFGIVSEIFPVFSRKPLFG